MSWNDQVIEEFRANGGQVAGNFDGHSMLLLHTTGAKSGLTRVNPLVYISDDDRYVVAASKGGADSHPDWFFNVQANPDVSLEVGTEKIKARAVVPGRPERDELYAKLAARYSFFAEYELKTERIIPIVVIEPTG